MELSLYNDEKSCPEHLNKKTIYRLWLHCCRRSNAVTLEEMISFQPQAEEKLRFYDRFVDENEKTSLNPAEYEEYKSTGKTRMAQKNKAR